MATTEGKGIIMAICKKCQGFIVIKTLVKARDLEVSRLRSEYGLAIKHYKEYKEKYKEITANWADKVEETEELFNVVYNGICCDINQEVSKNG